MTAAIVLAKLPVPGRVKTRLCPPLSPECAAEIATACLRDTLDAIRATPGVTRRVAVLDRLGEKPPEWMEDFEFIDQADGGLDRRLAAAFAAVNEPAVLVGMDTPQATPNDIGHAVIALDTAQSTIGFAPDGGFWIIGLRRPDDRVFIDVPMSTAQTGAAQLARLRSLGQEPVVVGEMRDMDSVDDLDYLAVEFPRTRAAQMWAPLRVS